MSNFNSINELLVTEFGMSADWAEVVADRINAVDMDDDASYASRTEMASAIKLVSFEATPEGEDFWDDVSRAVRFNDASFFSKSFAECVSSYSE